MVKTKAILMPVAQPEMLNLLVRKKYSKCSKSSKASRICISQISQLKNNLMISQ